MIKTTPLQNLHDGDRFEIPFLKDSMRNLQVLRVGSCSVNVRGERFVDFVAKTEREDTAEDKAGDWKPFSYSIALSTPVVYIGKGEMPTQEEIAPRKRGRKVKTVIPSTTGEVKRGRGRPRNSNKVVKPKSTNGRGRPAKVLNIKFPETGNFTIAEVAKASGCEKYDVINYLAKMKKAGTPIELKEKGKKRTSKRGRATTVYYLK